MLDLDVYSIHGFDILLFSTYLTFAFLVAVLIRSLRIHDDTYKRFFLYGFGVKVFGGFLFTIIFIYHYNGGDTFLYQHGSKIMALTFYDDPATYFRLLVAENGNLPADLHEFNTSIMYSRTKEEFFMVKLLSPIAIISFNSYLTMTLFTSIISFFGSWKLFQVFTDILPERKTVLFLIVFLLPSTFFWGSGILKDCFAMTAINIMIYALYFMIFKRKFHTKFWVYLIAGASVLLMIKLYILVSFLPAMALGIYSNFKNRIKSEVINIFMRPLLFVGLAVAAYFLALNLGELNQKYAVDKLEDQARGFHTWHVTTGGSAYTLGEIDYSPLGVAKKVPAALTVTFFRPFVWEARNPMMLLGSMEGLVLLLLVIYTIWLWGYKVIGAVRNDPLLMTLFVFVVVFGFAVGFTSYNFGALARYKIPISSIVFFIVLYLIDSKRKIDKKNKARQEEEARSLSS